MRKKLGIFIFSSLLILGCSEDSDTVVNPESTYPFYIVYTEGGGVYEAFSQLHTFSSTYTEYEGVVYDGVLGNIINTRGKVWLSIGQPLSDIYFTDNLYDHADEFDEIPARLSNTELFDDDIPLAFPDRIRDYFSDTVGYALVTDSQADWGNSQFY